MSDEAMRPAGRGFWRRVRRGLLGLVLLIVALLAVLHLPPVQRSLVAEVFSRLENRLGLAVGFDDFRFNLLTRTVTIRDLRVGVPGATPLVTAPRVDVSFPLAAFQGELDGLEVELHGAQVALIREDDRWTTMPARWFAPRETEGGGGAPAFARLALRDLDVLYADRDDDFTADTEGLTVDLRPVGPAGIGGLAGDVEPGATSRIAWDDRGTTATVQDGRMHFSPDAVGMDGLQLALPEGIVNADVRFAFREDPRLRLVADADLRGEALGRWTDALATAAGPLHVRLTMPASADEAFADLRVRSPGFAWRGLQIPALEGAGALGTGHVTFETLALQVAGGRLQGEGRLAWADELTSRATATGRGLDAGVLFRAFGEVEAIRLLAPASLVSGRFSGTWPSWDADALSGTLNSTWAARPSGATAGERWWFDGELEAQFRRGPWILSVDQRMRDALDMEGTLRIGTDRDRSYGEWALGGELALSGGTAGTLHAAAALFDTTVPVSLDEATGTLAGSASLGGRLGEPQAEVDLASTLAWPDQPEVTSRIGATVGTDRIAVHRFEAESGPSRMTAEADIDLERSTISGRFEGDEVAAAAWTRRFDLGSPAEAVVDVSGTVQGPLDGIVIDGQVASGALTLAGQSFGEGFTSRVRFGDRALVVEQFRLAQAEGAVTGDLEWIRETGALSATMDVDSVRLATRVPGLTAALPADAPVQLETRVTGRVTIGGTVDAPVVSAQLEAPDLLLDGESLGPATARVETVEDRVSAVVQAPELGLAADAALTLSGDRPFELKARVETTDLPVAIALAGVPIEAGAIDLAVSASGALATPSLSRIDARIDQLEARVAGLPVTADPGGRIQWTPDRLTAEGVELNVGQAYLRADGELRAGEGPGVAVRTEGRLQDLRPAVALLAGEELEGMVLEGPFCLALQVTGSPEAPRLTGSLDLDGARIGDGDLPPLEDVWVRLGLDAEQLRLNLVEARWQGAHLALSGAVPARMLGMPQAPPGGVAELRGHLDEVTIAVLEPFFQGEALSATSFRSRLEFTARAAEPSLDAIVADIEIAEAVLKSRDLGLAQRRPAELHLEDGVLMLAPWTLGTPWSTRTALTLAGGVRLAEPAALDFSVDGRIDLQAMSLLLGTYQPSGVATVDLQIQGPATGAALAGSVLIEDGGLLIRDPRLVFANLDGAVRFLEGRIVVDDLQGTLNGGTLVAAGTMRQPGRGEPAGAIVITARNVLLNEPAGVRSVIDADLHLRERQPRGFQLAGTVTVEQAAYRQPLLVTGGLLSLLAPSESILPAPLAPDADDGPPFVTLDVSVVADDSIAIDTTFGRLSLGADLRVRGSVENPRITGQATVAPGGELYVGGRTYRIESGIIEWRDPTSLTPDVRLVARTTAGGYDVTMEVQLQDGVTETDLRSDPPIPEQDIASLLLYGDRTASGARAGELVTEQLAAALSGELVGAVGRAFGIDAVRVGQDNPADVLFDSSLISTDSNPAQRITFSERVFPDLEVIVSQSLRESGDITWIVSWQPLQRFELRFAQLDNRDRSYEIRHDLSFGGGTPRLVSRERRRPQERVRDVRIVAAGDATEEAVRDRLRLTAGDRFDFYDWQRDRDRLIDWLIDQGYYEATVHAHRDPPVAPEEGSGDTPVDLTYEVATGPRTVLSVSGVDLPGEVQRALAQAWADVPTDQLLAEEITARLRPWLASEGYLQPDIRFELRRSPGAKVALVQVDPGPEFTERVFRFEGNEQVPGAELRQAIEAAGLQDAAWTSPELVAEVVTRAYRQRGYLAAEVEVGTPAFTGGRAEMPVRIAEGPLFRAGSVRVEDSAPEPASGVETSPPVRPGETLSDRKVADAVRELRRRYLLGGYRGTTVRASSTAQEDEATVDLVFHVNRGPRLQLRELRVEGADNASRAMIADAVGMDPGEPVSMALLNRARDRLYDTGLFRTVSVEPGAVTDDGPDDETEIAGDASSGVRLVDAVVEVEELPQYRLRYGVQLFDPVTEDVDPIWGEVDPGVVVDLTRRGLFGRGVTGGLGVRVNPSQQAVRAYLSTRTFFDLPLQTNVYVGDEREQTGAEPFELAYRARDFTFEQRARRARLVQVYYGYNFRRITYDFSIVLPGQPFPLPVSVEADISRLMGTAVLDRRDSVIDTRRGWFHSSSFEVAPEALGTTIGFTKYLGQAFLFRPVAGGLVAGSAARVEIASGPGRSLIVSERLRSGGGSTVRGYVDDTAQLRDLTATTEGTTGISVFNQELRFPVFWRLSGAAFWDHASLFGDLEAFDGLRVRNSVGAGLRLTLPFILVRVDFGYPLNRDDVNDEGRWYFAIGQAF